MAVAIPQQVWDRIDVRSPNECWPWTGQDNGHGYPVFRGVPVTRMILGLTKGDGLIARHKCDNPPCCNPAHLEPGTHQDNMDDMWARGRGLRGERQGQAKLTAADIPVIRADARPSHAIAKDYGVSSCLIIKIKRGKCWKHIPMDGPVSVLTRDRFDKPTERQLEVLRGLAAGLSSTEIAAEMGVHYTTVCALSRKVLKKLGVATRPDAVAAGIRMGLVEQHRQEAS